MSWGGKFNVVLKLFGIISKLYYNFDIENKIDLQMRRVYVKVKLLFLEIIIGNCIKLKCEQPRLL